MTWEELAKKAESCGYTRIKIEDCENYPERFVKLDENGAGLEFLINGEVLCANGGFSDTISKNRTPDQMYQIIQALED